jgi:predicted MPP superfamily phosphohydrolase
MPMGFRIRNVELKILPPGRKPLRVLHFSDVHLTPRNSKILKFMNDWNSLSPDLIISTGDHIADADAIPLLIDALKPLRGIPSFYVFGSNDYYAPSFKNPLRYLMPDRGIRIHGPELPWPSLDNGLQDLGWVKLHDLKIETEVAGTTLELRGTDDAHLKLDRYERVKGRRALVDISLGVTHAPYKRILDAMSLDGLDLIFSGHTHGGQIRIPWFGKTRSLTTNCDLPNWRSRGLTKIEGEPWLHVSAGLGTNPWTPVRFLCEPEISLLNLVS